MVISGNERGKRGEVLEVFPDKNRILVSKVNFVKRHTRPTQTQPGGIREKEASLALANVVLICPKCDQPTRPKFEQTAEGKSRVCRKCGEMIL